MATWRENQSARKAYTLSLPNDARRNLIEIIEASPKRRRSGERQRLLDALRSAGKEDVKIIDAQRNIEDAERKLAQARRDLDEARR